MNHRILKLSLAASLSAIPFSAVHATAPAAGAPAAIRLDDDYPRYPHMHHALDRLREARSELDQAEDIFNGHKAEALDHVDRAIEQVKTGLEEQGEKAAVIGAPAAKPMDDHYPHLHHALDALYHARDELQSAEDVFRGHRDAALDQVNHAIHQIEDAVHDG
jgi:hypothetical protein